ncbi:unnamed protein product [Rhodiola kirilowii]
MLFRLWFSNLGILVFQGGTRCSFLSREYWRDCSCFDLKHSCLYSELSCIAKGFCEAFRCSGEKGLVN